jgi:hypothetical protein
MALIYLYVPIEFEKRARKALEELENADIEPLDGDEGDSVE